MHILKCHGLSLLDSKVEPGYALNCVRASQGMPTCVTGAKIACLDINLQRYKMQMGVQVRACVCLGWNRAQLATVVLAGSFMGMLCAVFLCFPTISQRQRHGGKVALHHGVNLP